MLMAVCTCKERKMKVAVITGGAKGIGFGILKKFVENNIYCYIFDMDEEASKKAICYAPNLIKAIKVDLTKDKEVEIAFQSVVREQGQINYLICNAGIAIRKWAFDFTMDDYDKLMSVNLRAYYMCSKIAAKIMSEQKSSIGGTIVCISSVNSISYHSKRSLYNTSKAAINGMVGTLGVEWARFGIRINAVAPGYVLTELLQKGIDDGIIDETNIMSVIPMKRYITIDEVAKTVYFLASDDSSGITGQVLCVDGGWSKNALPENY